MKLYTFIVFVLAFWPILLDCSLDGHNALVATRVFPTKTFSTSDAYNAGIAKLGVPPTSYPRVHNKKGLSSWVDSTISIWTANQVSPDHGAAGVRRASINLINRQLQAQWSRVCHWWRIGSAWLVDAFFNLTLYVLFILVAGIALLQKPTVEQRVVVTYPPRKPTFVSSLTQHRGPSSRQVHDLVTQKQQSITIFTLEGRLVLYSAPTTSDSPVEWTVLLHPRQYYSATGYLAESISCNAQFSVPDARLLNILLRGVSAYHPWSLYLPAIHVTLPVELIKDLRSTSKFASVAKTTATWSTPERTIQEQPVRRRLVGICLIDLSSLATEINSVIKPPRKLTFTPSIHRFGGQPKPAVSQLVPPKKPRHPVQWIERFTIEGCVLLYAGSTPPGLPVKWIVQFRPRSGYHLTGQGDESSRRQRDFVDGRLLDILLNQGLAYPRSVIYVPDILLGLSGETVKQSNNLAVLCASLDLTTTVPSLPSSAPQTPDATTTLDYTASSIDILAASARLETSAEPEVPVAPGLREDRSSAERAEEAVPANAEGNAENSTEWLDYPDSQTPDSEEVEPFTSISRAPTSPNHTSLDTTSDDLILEQKAAVVHELRLLFALLEEQAGQSHAQTAWEDAETEVREQEEAEEAHVENVQQDMAEEAPVEEDVPQNKVDEAPAEEDVRKQEDVPGEEDVPVEGVQQEKVHQRKKRRGGQRNTLWKNKCRQAKEDNERDPEAGPSGSR
ncbi:hypothetical protein FRC00_013936 [Tulasnella sp. 408]|nr:hypothetical protein FRC00_013936 [Tulasnella sp. 408]